mmetsp:Transcript_13947/g.27287  ORF Transcript_13947/g.27287 Transcript_13947/m.27287 type:complete len:225 (-) Transcript_13947:511-1185(-)
MNLDAEEADAELDAALDHAEEQVKRKDAVRDSAEQREKVVELLEVLVEEERRGRLDEHVKDHLADPQDGDGQADQAEHHRAKVLNRVAAALLVGDLDLLPVLLQKVDGLLELSIVGLGLSVSGTRGVAAELDADVVQLVSALVEQHLLLCVLLEVDALRPRVVRHHQIGGDCGKTDTAEKHEEEPADEGDERHDVDHRRHRDGVVVALAFARALGFAARPVHGH